MTVNLKPDAIGFGQSVPRGKGCGIERMRHGRRVVELRDAKDALTDIADRIWRRVRRNWSELAYDRVAT